MGKGTEGNRSLWNLSLGHRTTRGIKLVHINRDLGHEIAVYKSTMPVSTERQMRESGGRVTVASFKVSHQHLPRD
jgi:hypothetical protein